MKTQNTGTITYPEAATYVGLGRTKFGELVRSGQIPSVKIGTRRLFVVSALDRWLEQQLDANDHNGLSGLAW